VDQERVALWSEGGLPDGVEAACPARARRGMCSVISGVVCFETEIT
jgi:hypothetical protein